MLFLLPNFLSLLRILLTPLCMWLLFQGGFYLFWSFAVFFIAAMTDMLDGHAARYYGGSTAFGSFLDPLADKVLVLGAFVAFYFKDLIPLWFVVILFARDVVITMLRTFLVDRGTPLVTSKIAKYKTFLQCMLIYLLFAYVLMEEYGYGFVGMNKGVMVSVYFVAVLTVYSAYDYIRPLILRGDR
ncbi:MAG: CDP-diacylglycerol--glycerol-3-phosphate 3-phosphatidyltransferase [bacterium]